MNRKFILLALLNISYVFAQGEIVYLIPGEVFANSRVLVEKFKQQQASYKQQQGNLLKQVDKIQGVINKSDQTSLVLEQSSAALYNLQNEIESLNSQNASYSNKLQNDYMVYVRKASNELYLRNQYSYILNDSGIVITDPKNNVSLEVSQLADKLYQADHK